MKISKESSCDAQNNTLRGCCLTWIMSFR